MKKPSAKEKWFLRHGIGKVPLGWRKVSFGELVTLSQYGLSSDTGEEGPFPLLKMNNINDGQLVFDGLDLCRVKGKDIDKYRLRRGDFLFNRTNSRDLVGKACLYTKDDICFAASYIVRFVFSDEVNPNYVNYWWQNDMAKHRLAALSTIGVSQSNINPTVLQKSFFVLLPRRLEQDAIVKILSHLDKHIGLTEDLISYKQERRRWLAQHLLTGMRRMPGFTKRWRTVHLGDVFINRLETKFTDLPLVAITGDNGVVRRDDLIRRDTSAEDKNRYLRICPGDIGYNTMRMWQGVCGFSRLEGIVSPAYTVVTPTGAVDGEFMASLFKSPPVVYLFHRHSQGLVNDTLNLKYRYFAKIKVSIPAKEEQVAIAAILRVADRELDLLRTQVVALREQKRGLMQQLLTGKRRMKAAIEVTA